MPELRINLVQMDTINKTVTMTNGTFKNMMKVLNLADKLLKDLDENKNPDIEQLTKNLRMFIHETQEDNIES